MDRIIEATVILLILSLITEKIANFIKMQFESLYLKSSESKKEKERVKRIQTLTIAIGVSVALISKANLFLLFKENFQLFWTDIGSDGILSAIIGSIIAGLFLSLGSKFFHDLLDMLLEVKNLKRKLNDRADWEFETIEEVDNYIKGNEMVELKSFLNKRFNGIENYHYHEIDYKNEIISIYANASSESFPVTIPYKTLAGKIKFFKTQIFEEADGIKTLSTRLNPSDEISNSINPFKLRGSISYPVKRKSDNKELIITCYHTVWTHGCDWSVYIPNEKIKHVVHPIDGISIGTIISAVKNGYFDVALIEPDPSIALGIDMRSIDSPEASREVTERDVTQQTSVRTISIQNSQDVSEGYIHSIGLDLNNIEYPDGGRMSLSDLIMIKPYGNSRFAIPGDSGSIVVDEWNYAIGIVVAGNSNTTFAMPIETILNSFNLKLK